MKRRLDFALLYPTYGASMVLGVLLGKQGLRYNQNNASV